MTTPQGMGLSQAAVETGSSAGRKSGELSSASTGSLLAGVPPKLFLFAFFGWVFDFYDLVLLGFLKVAVGKDLGLTHAAEG